MTITTALTSAERDALAQETAEYIAGTIIPAHDRFAASPWVTVSYPDDRRPPTEVDGIKAELLAGSTWISWMDDRVTAAMRQLHGAEDIEPCIDCGVPLHLSTECYAVDGAVVCGSCGQHRYGDRAAEYKIA